MTRLMQSGPYSVAASKAIILELNRLCLGGRGPERPELVPTRLEVLDYFRTDGGRRTKKIRRGKTDTRPSR